MSKPNTFKLRLKHLFTQLWQFVFILVAACSSGVGAAAAERELSVRRLHCTSQPTRHRVLPDAVLQTQRDTIDAINL
jgi:hypothetical protein